MTRSISDLDLLGAIDGQVLAPASESGRTLIRADTDFGALLSVAGGHLDRASCSSAGPVAMLHSGLTPFSLRSNPPG